jgi:hypothetical protein
MCRFGHFLFLIMSDPVVDNKATSEDTPIDFAKTLAMMKKADLFLSALVLSSRGPEAQHAFESVLDEIVEDAKTDKPNV